MKSKRSGGLLTILCGGAVAATLLVASPLAMSQTDATKMKDAAKDAAKQAKDAAKQAKDAAQNAAKKAEDAVKDATGGGQPEMTPEMMEGMKRAAEYGATNEHHKHLAKYEGEWEIVGKMWMDPSMPPEEMNMKSTGKMTMGGRYLIEKVTGEFDMGNGPEKFDGMATMGYDNHKKMYFSTWIDSSSSGMMTEWGTCSENDTVLTMEGTAYDPWDGAERKTKSISTIIDADTRKLEMFRPGPDGKMWKNMEMVYKRKK